MCDIVFGCTLVYILVIRRRINILTMTEYEKHCLLPFSCKNAIATIGCM